MEYQIQIPERLRRSATVSATSEIEAVEIVRQYYKEAYYKSPNNDFILAHGDCFKLLKEFDFKFDMIFAGPVFTPSVNSDGVISWSNNGKGLSNPKPISIKGDKGDMGALAHKSFYMVQGLLVFSTWWKPCFKIQTLF